jgi:hypothetical protein
MTARTDPLSLADRIRAFVHLRHVEPARAAGKCEVEVRAGDVHQDMSLTSRMPAVCSALGGKFEREYGVELVARSGPPQGANVYFLFRLNPTPAGANSGLRTAKRPPRAAAKDDVRRAPAPSCWSRSHGSADTLYLVSCVSKKRPIVGRARDLYTSDWFLKARAYVERTGAPWYILSAEHGLLSPDEVIAPYERTLNTMPVDARRRWAERVLAQLSATVPEARHITFLAGLRYREFLGDLLMRAGIAIQVPMSGLRIGEQLSWLGRG